VANVFRVESTGVNNLTRRVKKPVSRIAPKQSLDSSHNRAIDVQQNGPAAALILHTLHGASDELQLDREAAIDQHVRLSNDSAPIARRDLDPANGYEVQNSQENIFQQVDVTHTAVISAEIFDEVGYLRLNPDVRLAIELGQIESGYAHYLMHGLSENRPLPDVPKEARNVMLPSAAVGRSSHSSEQTRCAIEALIIAPSAGLMVVGWIDDAIHPITCIRIIAQEWRVAIDTSCFIRVRRTDVEKALNSRALYSYGFFGFLHFDRSGHTKGPVQVELWQTGGFSSVLQCAASVVEDLELRNTVLAHLAGASFFGNPAIESMRFLGQGMGAELVRFNTTITRRLVAQPYVERFGSQEKPPRGTIIICLYGKAEFYFLQSCLFAGLPGIDEYEFVFVSNSPEIGETLLREAHSATLIYGLKNSIMILGGNAGFGGANNAAANIARSSRLLVVNPDIFPRDREWAKKHSDLLDAAPPEQTRLFGVPLYYDDGSLMHGGMYLETDVGLVMSGGTPVGRRICRVEHYGKGAPAESPHFTRSRPVPAVSGAFMSIERWWFEQLGGFTEDFIFGHYEDADLCLKSIGKGVAPWLQDIRMWHLEGKGSRRQLAHEGGSLVNRWLFTEKWIDLIDAELKGPTPPHRLMQPSTSPSLTNLDAGSAKFHSKRRIFQ
jgi:GT2 family glycosyltransferase